MMDRQGTRRGLTSFIFAFSPKLITLLSNIRLFIYLVFFPVVFFDINTDNELGIFRKNTLRDDDFYDLEVNFTDSLAVGRAGIGLSTI